MLHVFGVSHNNYLKDLCMRIRYPSLHDRTDQPNLRDFHSPVHTKHCMPEEPRCTTIWSNWTVLVWILQSPLWMKLPCTSSVLKQHDESQPNKCSSREVYGREASTFTLSWVKRLSLVSALGQLLCTKQRGSTTPVHSINQDTKGRRITEENSMSNPHPILFSYNLRINFREWI